MKILPLILVLFFLMTSYTVESQIYFGAKVGANVTNFRGDLENANFKAGFHVGGVAEIIINDDISFQPELLYSVQGFQDKDNSSLLYNYNYIQAPLMIKYFIKDLVTLDGGLQVGYLISTTHTNGFEEIVYDQEELANSLDYGVNLGATYEMDSGIFLQLRYNFGLANTFNSDVDYKAYNNVIQVSMGYKFY